MLRFAIIGTGYRSEFYARAAKLSKDLVVAGWLARNEEKKIKLNEKYGIYTFIDPNELYSMNLDFVVVCVDKAHMNEVSIEYAKKGFNVLMETPCGTNLDEINRFEEAIKDYHIQVAEQYTHTPYIKALIKAVDSNIIGDITTLSLSYAHMYHAISIARSLLKTNSEIKNIYGSSYNTLVTRTIDRYHTFTDGTLINARQDNLVIEYTDNLVLFYNFTSESYRSPIRNRYINIRGTRGEIINDTIYYLDQNNIPQTKKIRYNHKALSDEYAIKEMLLKMKDYINKCIEVYPNEYALNDAKCALIMEETLRSKK